MPVPAPDNLCRSEEFLPGPGILRHEISLAILNLAKGLSNMPITTIHEAKTNLSKLLERAERGEEVLLARGKKVVAKVVPISATPRKRRLNILQGKIKVSRKFFEPLPKQELDDWGR
jgi:antitoxin (DNA-binding transcriptional repressor) of toxin-antitoxin stability system